MNWLSIERRFWEKVNVAGPTVRKELGPCSVWTGALSPKGYGHAWDGKKVRPAAQVAWELGHRRPFPKGKMSCHHCDNPACVRWEHIYAGDNFTNQRDRVRRGRHERANMTHCAKGHPLSGDNVYRWGTRRKCRTCQRARHAKYCAKRNAKGYWKSGQSHGWVLRKELR